MLKIADEWKTNYEETTIIEENQQCSVNGDTYSVTIKEIPDNPDNNLAMTDTVDSPPNNNYNTNHSGSADKSEPATSDPMYKKLVVNMRENPDTSKPAKTNTLMDMPSIGTLKQVKKRSQRKQADRPVTLDAHDSQQEKILAIVATTNIPPPCGNNISPIKNYKDWEKKLAAKEKELKNREVLTRKMENKNAECTKQLAALRTYTLELEQRLNDVSEENKTLKTRLLLHIEKEGNASEPQRANNKFYSQPIDPNASQLSQMMMTQMFNMMEMKHSLHMSDIERKISNLQDQVERSKDHYICSSRCRPSSPCSRERARPRSPYNRERMRPKTRSGSPRGRQPSYHRYRWPSPPPPRFKRSWRLPSPPHRHKQRDMSPRNWR